MLTISVEEPAVNNVFIESKSPSSGSEREPDDIQLWGKALKTRTRISGIRVLTLLLTTFAAVTAVAQNDARSAAAASGSGEFPIEEVVVTAQKRGEQTLQDVPISIDVLGGECLDSATSMGVGEALNEVSGVALHTEIFTGGLKVAVRGVASPATVFGGSNVTGYYLDNVPFGLVRTSITPDANVYDLQRVEVLRGPQGTLYGANSLNGVVRVLTNNANLDSYEFKARASLSDTDGGSQNGRADLAFNVPLVSGKLALRGVLGYNRLSGWIDNLTSNDANEGELQNFRIKIKAQPTDALSLDLGAWSSRSDFDTKTVTGEEPGQRDRFNEPLASGYDAYNATISYGARYFVLTSATSYIDSSIDNDLDLGNFGTDVLLTSKFGGEVFAQEINVTSAADESWRWSVGGMYRDAKENLVSSIPEIAFLADSTHGSESIAIFGEVTRSVLDGKLDLTAGLRYFEDEVTLVTHFDSSGPNVPDQKRTFYAVSPRLVATWYPADDLTAYVSYAEGFRSGVHQGVDVLRVLPGAESAAEDTLKNYEIGLKTTFFDGRVVFDGALFFIDWQDVKQLRQFLDPVTGGTTANQAVNGETASGPGIDLGLTAKASERLRLALSVGWNDLTSDTDIVSGGSVITPKGERLDFSAETTANVSGDYVFPMARGLEGQLSASANYVSEIKRAGGVSDKMTTARLSFSISSAQHWTTTFYVDNLTNEDGAVIRENPGNPNIVRLRPRTVGLQVEYRH